MTIWSGVRICLLGASLALLYLVTFWPGMLSTDSLSQYRQAATRSYSSIHPPLMSFIWARLLFTNPPSVGYLALQVSLISGGLTLLGIGFARSGLRWPWLVVLTGLLPTVWEYAGVLWKDVLLTG